MEPRRRPAVESLEPRRLLAVDLALAGPQAVAPDGPNVRASFDAVGEQSEMSVSINPANPLNIVALSHAIGQAWLDSYYSFDGGVTWTQRRIDQTQDGINGGSSRFDPTLAFDRTGRVYLAYGVTPSGGTRQLVVTRSTDGGASYTGTAVIATNSSLDKWTINTGRDPVNPNQENVYLAYRIGTGSNITIRNAASYDGGVTFPVNVIVPADGIAGTDFSSFGMPAVGPDGELFVVWDDYENTPASSRIKLARSLDGGATFGPTRLVSDTPVTRGNANGFPSSARYHISAQPDRGILTVPTIAVDRSNGPNRGRLYAAYTIRGVGGTSDNTDVVVRSSDDDGVTWSAPVAVHATANTASQFLPWMDVDRTSGAVGVVYYDTRNSGTNQLVETWAAVSIDGGASFTESRLATTQSNQSQSNPSRYAGNYLEYIGLSFHDGTLQAIWADNRVAAGDLELFTARAAVDGAQNVLTVTGDEAGPAADTITIDTPAANASYLAASIGGTTRFAGLRDTVGAVRLNGGALADTIIVRGVPGVPVSIDGGAGLDVVQVDPIAGPLTTAVFNNSQDLASLLVGDNGRLTLAAAGGDKVVRLDGNAAPTVNPLGAFDLTRHALAIDHAPAAAPLAALRALLVNGRAGGAWNGLGGINSSTAAGAPGTALGFAASADVFTAFPAAFAGTTLDDSALLVRYTLSGDANLDRTVDIGDFSVLAARFNQAVDRWSQGDFDYTGTTDIADFSLLAAAFNQSLPGGLPRSIGPAVLPPAGATPAGLPDFSRILIEELA